MSGQHVADLIQPVFALHADRVFLIDCISDKGPITYCSFEIFARKAAQRLQNKGVKEKNRLGIFCDNRPEFIVLYFACLYLGVTVVPINPALTQSEITFILQHASIDHLIAADAMSSSLFTIKDDSTPLHLIDEIVKLHEHPQDETLAPASHPDISTNHYFSIHFTSGTTAHPKGVVHSVGGLLANAAKFNEQFEINESCKMLHVMPMAYMAGFLNTVLSPFMAGGTVVLAPQFGVQSALRFWEPVMNHSVNSIWFSPTMLASLMSLDRSDKAPHYCSTHMRHLFVGTAPLPLKLKNSFESKYGVHLFESYGLSELLLISANGSHYEGKTNSAGRVLSDVHISTVDDNDSISLDGRKEGELLVRTPFQMAGYLNYQTGKVNPLADDGWFPTGDVGFVDSDKNLFITARKKDLIIRGGFNISPRAVEDILMKHQSIIDAAVVGIPHEFHGEEVAAAIIFKDDVEDIVILKKEITQLCRSMLAVHSVPTILFEMSSFPKSVIGKIQKNKIRETIILSRIK